MPSLPTRATGSPVVASWTSTPPPDDACHLLDGVAKGLAGPITVTTHAVSAHPATAILSVAEVVDADLIVVGNRGMKGVRRLLGSVPANVSHHAACDVLVVDTVDTV